MLANRNGLFVIRLFIVLGSRGFFRSGVFWENDPREVRAGNHVGQECPTYGASDRGAQHTARRAGVPNIHAVG